jgi:hypothetical protein
MTAQHMRDVVGRGMWCAATAMTISFKMVGVTCLKNQKIFIGVTCFSVHFKCVVCTYKLGKS